ncbi:MAG TPA: RNA polymerase sigma factor [Flavipsychrobacter sp.]|nr:RNA polymerase sigma factor [Flavipsychrobacter sp.]
MINQIAEEGISDSRLIKEILEGQKRSFEPIIRKYNQRLYRIGMSILRNETEVEDAMQTAYIKAYENLAQFEQRAAFGTWLTKIMLNQCYEQKRKNRSLPVTIEETNNAIQMKTPANILANKELSGILEAAIAELPEKYRLVFIMREIEDLSVKETSEALNIEESNVKVRLNRAKGMLRNNLGGYVKDNVYSFHLYRCDKIVEYVMGRIGTV